ncbi:DUF4249 domain-containing protein [Pontibacter beigongshangensis]|uniref:DUF4249 domain-containing protein n=1 Tax=Pontibacter beigongshangensis TaxID=2574733 RepID=UPI001650BB63|nr:DUF4249 domain-containing protein [Pontibacter beigongshangensis]
MKTNYLNRNRIPQLVLLLLTLFVLPACEDDVTNIRNLDVSPKLVVTSFISPQDTFLVAKLQTSQPAIGKMLSEEQRKVKDAAVTISDGLTTVTLPYNADLNSYQTEAVNLPPVAGKTYTLKVSTPAGAKAEASCVVPAVDNIEITEINYTATRDDEEYHHNFWRYDLSYKWIDAPGVTNYYHALAYMKYQVEVWPNKLTMFNDIYPTLDKGNLVKDESAVNNVLQSPKFTQYGNDLGPVPRPYTLYAYLMVTEKHYYLYHRSVLEQQEVSGNPFAEPKFIYSNMAGALGAFGAYNRLEAVKEIK